MINASRREFLQAFGAAAVVSWLSGDAVVSAADASSSRMKLGLCTFQWGKDWDVPTIIANCEKTGVLAVELRTEHKHRVEPSLGPQTTQGSGKAFCRQSRDAGGSGLESML